jgi:hypothetical protein
MRENKLDQSSIDQHLSMYCLLSLCKTKGKQFLVDNILTEGLFVTQLSGTAGIAL